MHLKITGDLIGQGVFGKVFEGELSNGKEDSETNVAVKIAHVTSEVEHPLLLHEACALSILKGHPSIPQVHAWGRSQFYEYIALQKLGPTLKQFMVPEGAPLSVRNLAILAYQMIDVVQHMHSKGIIHCDIKPDNFVFGPPGSESAGRLYLIDFGHSKYYRDPATGKHLPLQRTSRRTACRTFASVFDHLHQSLCRGDDMTAVAYTITAMLVRPLPWERAILEDAALEAVSEAASEAVSDDDIEPDDGSGELAEGDGIGDESGDLGCELSEDYAAEGSGSDGEDTTGGELGEEDSVEGDGLDCEDANESDSNEDTALEDDSESDREDVTEDKSDANLNDATEDEPDGEDAPSEDDPDFIPGRSWKHTILNGGLESKPVGEDAATKGESESNKNTAEDNPVDGGIETAVPSESQRPWTMLDIVNCKIRWSEGYAITQGYPTVFSDFLTYAFHIPYGADPNYDHWKTKFRQAFDDLPDDMLYDPSDTCGQMAGKDLSTIKTMDTPEKSSLVTDLWYSSPRSSIDPVKDGWRPTEDMIWYGPHSLEPGQAFGPSELKIVKHSGIQILQDTPQSDIQLLASGCPQEHMVKL